MPRHTVRTGKRRLPISQEAPASAPPSSHDRNRSKQIHYMFVVIHSIITIGFIFAMVFFRNRFALWESGMLVFQHVLSGVPVTTLVIGNEMRVRTASGTRRFIVIRKAAYAVVIVSGIAFLFTILYVFSLVSILRHNCGEVFSSDAIVAAAAGGNAHVLLQKYPETAVVVDDSHPPSDGAMGKGLTDVVHLSALIAHQVCTTEHALLIGAFVVSLLVVLIDIVTIIFYVKIIRHATHAARKRNQTFV